MALDAILIFGVVAILGITLVAIAFFSFMSERTKLKAKEEREAAEAEAVARRENERREAAERNAALLSMYEQNGTAIYFSRGRIQKQKAENAADDDTVKDCVFGREQTDHK